jgi:hypothetical protein
MFWMFSRERDTQKEKLEGWSMEQSRITEQRKKAVEWLGERYICHPANQVKKKEGVKK